MSRSEGQEGDFTTRTRQQLVLLIPPPPPPPPPPPSPEAMVHGNMLHSDLILIISLRPEWPVWIIQEDLLGGM